MKSIRLHKKTAVRKSHFPKRQFLCFLTFSYMQKNQISSTRMPFFSTVFDFIKCLVRSLVDFTASTDLFGKNHCSDAETQRNTMCIILCGICREIFYDRLSFLTGDIFSGNVLHQNHEFVSAHPEDLVSAPEMGSQKLYQIFQNTISDRMTTGIIQIFKIIQIK